MKLPELDSTIKTLSDMRVGGTTANTVGAMREAINGLLTRVDAGRAVLARSAGAFSEQQLAEMQKECDRVHLWAGILVLCQAALRESEAPGAWVDVGWHPHGAAAADWLRETIAEFQRKHVLEILDKGKPGKAKR